VMYKLRLRSLAELISLATGISGVWSNPLSI
jgi:hypothetical protein